MYTNEEIREAMQDIKKNGIDIPLGECVDHKSLKIAHDVMRRYLHSRIDEENKFYLHANSVNAAQGCLRHGPTKDLPCAQAMDSIIHHLQCEIYILMEEIEKLKESSH